VLAIKKSATALRGGAYGSDAAKGMELQKGYLDLLFGFIGFTDVKSIMVEPTLAAPADVAKAEAAAMAEAEKIAATF
jgi:FMN-dependent NADH-azoreductase